MAGSQVARFRHVVVKKEMVRVRAAPQPGSPVTGYVARGKKLVGVPISQVLFGNSTCRFWPGFDGLQGGTCACNFRCVPTVPFGGQHGQEQWCGAGVLGR